jgi:hypothetical protein
MAKLPGLSVPERISASAAAAAFKEETTGSGSAEDDETPSCNKDSAVNTEVDALDNESLLLELGFLMVKGLRIGKL